LLSFNLRITNKQIHTQQGRVSHLDTNNYK
jgi:hypothetical protein